MMDNILRQALEKERDQVLADSRVVIAKALETANAEGQQALLRLESLVKAWEKAAETMSGFGLSSIAEVALAGGVVWTWRWVCREGHGEYRRGLADFLARAMSGYGDDQWPRVLLPDGQEFEIFVLARPLPPKIPAKK